MSRRALPIGYLIVALLGGLTWTSPWTWGWLFLLGCVAGLSWRRARRLWPATSATLAVCTFLAWAQGPGSAPWILCGVVGVTLLALFGPNRWWRLLTLFAVAIPLVSIAAVLYRDNWTTQLSILWSLAIGLAWSAGVTWALWDLGPTRANPVVPEHPPDRSGPVSPHGAGLSNAERWHGWSLVVVAATLPLGEGAVFGAAGLCLLMLIWRRVSPRQLWDGPAKPVVISFGVWIGAGLLSAALSGHGLLEPRELGRLGPVVLMPLIYLSIITLPPIWLDRATRAFTISLAVACGVALAQYSLNLVGEWPLAHQLVESLMKGAQSRVPNTTNELVAGGFFRHRLKMAHVVLLGITALMGRQLSVPLTNRRRIGELGLLLLFMATLLLTFTRGALLGLAAAVALAIWLGSPRWRLRATVAVVLIAAASFAVPTVRQRIVSIASPETGSDRAFIWAQATQIIGDHRLGIGLANYPTFAEAYYESAGSPFTPPRTYPHSLVLSAWAETGPVGLIGYLALWLALATAAFAGWRRRHDARGRTAALALLLTVAGFWVVGMTHDILFHKPVALTFSALLGACLAELSRPGDP